MSCSLEQVSENKITEMPKLIEIITTSREVDNIVSEIQKAKNTFNALAVGRNDYQDLPEEKGWKWTSLDCEMRKKELKERLHLYVNFNHEDMGKIKHLFDKIVVDLSVIKFCTKPWSTFQQLLVPNEQSTLIIECWTGTFTRGKETTYDVERGTMTVSEDDVNEYYSEMTTAFTNWKDKVGLDKANEEFEAFKKLGPEETGFFCETEEEFENTFPEYILSQKNLKPEHYQEKNVLKLIKLTQQYLQETFFEKVELHRGCYPYQPEGRMVQAHYFIASHPKHLK